MLDRSSQSLPMQALAFFVYATHTMHATQALALHAFEWKPGFRACGPLLCVKASDGQCNGLSGLHENDDGDNDNDD